MWSEQAEREVRYFVLDDDESLVYVANMATIPLHIWSSRLATLERPDWCIVDLDPKGAPFADVLKIARHVRALCDEIELPQLPEDERLDRPARADSARRALTYEQSRTLGELIARVIGEVAARHLDDRTQAVRRAAARSIVDYLQNGHGRLLVAPFSVRPLPGAPVSMPLEWKDVTARLKLERYNIKTARKRMLEHGDPLAGVLKESIDMLAAIDALQQRLSK